MRFFFFLSKLAAILQVLNPNCFCLIRISVLDHYPHTSTVFKLPNHIQACCTLSCLIRQVSAVIIVNKADIMCLFIIGERRCSPSNVSTSFLGLSDQHSSTLEAINRHVIQLHIFLHLCIHIQSKLNYLCILYVLCVQDERTTHIYCIVQLSAEQGE